MRTQIDIDAEALDAVTGQLELLGLSFVGTGPSPIKGALRVMVEGEWLPAAELVTIEIRRAAMNGIMQITATAKPLELIATDEAA